jgi:hypothetical protein
MLTSLFSQCFLNILIELSANILMSSEIKLTPCLFKSILRFLSSSYERTKLTNNSRLFMSIEGFINKSTISLANGNESKSPILKMVIPQISSILEMYTSCFE